MVVATVAHIIVFHHLFADY